jgi:hypothetical protein
LYISLTPNSDERIISCLKSAISNINKPSTLAGVNYPLRKITVHFVNYRPESSAAAERTKKRDLDQKQIFYAKRGVLIMPVNGSTQNSAVADS